MTLLVAVKVPARRLNPKKRPLQFSEKGIVIAADTRFSFRPGKRTVDDAQKLWPLGDHAFSGYAGDVEVAEKALLSAYAALGHHRRWDDQRYITSAVSTYLRHWHQDASARRPVGPTVVFLGLWSSKGRGRLFTLHSEHDFHLHEHLGVITEGTGASHFETLFDQEVDHITHQWAASPRPGDLMDIRIIDVALLVASSVDRTVQEAGLADVGGWTQMMTLSKQGMFAPRAHAVDGEAKWRPITRRTFRSYADMRARSFEAPLLDENCRFRDGWLVRVGTHPGLITGQRQKA